jgi:hypothetical protein
LFHTLAFSFSYFSDRVSHFCMCWPQTMIHLSEPQCSWGHRCVPLGLAYWSKWNLANFYAWSELKPCLSFPSQIPGTTGNHFYSVLPRILSFCFNVKKLKKLNKYYCGKCQSEKTTPYIITAIEHCEKAFLKMKKFLKNFSKEVF